MIDFIEEHSEEYGVEPICEVLPIAPSTYYEHAARRRDPGLRPDREKRDERLKVQVRRVWDDNFAVYGAVKSRFVCGFGLRGAPCFQAAFMFGATSNADISR
jgi:hypothetical protein